MTINYTLDALCIFTYHMNYMHFDISKLSMSAQTSAIYLSVCNYFLQSKKYYKICQTILRELYRSERLNSFGVIICKVQNDWTCLDARDIIVFVVHIYQTPMGVYCTRRSARNSCLPRTVTRTRVSAPRESMNLMERRGK